MFSKIFGLAFAVAIIIILPLLAATSLTANKAEDTTITGKIVCLACELKGSDGARADCALYGHREVLKALDGRYVYFLENRYSEDLLKGKKYHDKDVVVHGRYFSAGNLVDVKSFEVDGREYSWCAQCRDMDSCGADK